MWLSKEQKQQYRQINEKCVGKRYYCLRDGTNGYYATCAGVFDHEHLEMRRNDGKIYVVNIHDVREVEETGVSEDFKRVAKEVFDTNDELFRKLAES